MEQYILVTYYYDEKKDTSLGIRDLVITYWKSGRWKTILNITKRFAEKGRIRNNCITMSGFGLVFLMVMRHH